MADPRRVVDTLTNPRVVIPASVVTLTATGAGALAFFLNNWLYFAIPLFTVLIALVAYLVRGLYSKEREERGARGTGASDDATVIHRRSEGRSALAAASLEQSFKKAFAVVQARKLEGLPWYLVVGAPGAGKTALLRASGLELPSAVESLVESGPTSGVSFWLTNQAVLVDTAGRLSATHAGEDDKDWKTLLGLLRKHCTRPAIQGVLVACSAPELMGRETAELEETASELRRHLNDVVDELGVDPPVYLVVTQADRIQGLVEVASGFGSSRLGEMLGWTHRERYPHDIAQTVRDAFQRLRDRLESGLPELLVREPEAQRRRRLVLVGQEIGSLARALASFTGRAFQPTRYDEVPFLRGIYLTSAVRQGALVSPLLDKLGQRWAASPVESGGSPGGWFTKDLFRKLLLDPEEQSLSVATETLGPRTRSVLVALASVTALVCVGLWGVSFWNNWGTVAGLRRAAVRVDEQRHSLEAQDELRAAIEEAETLAREPSHSFGLGLPARRATRRAQEAFVLAFGAEFERHAKADLVGRVRSSDPSAFAALLDLVADVSFMAARGAEGAVRPGIEHYGNVRDTQSEQEAFAAGYSAFVKWAPDVELESRIEEEQKRFEDDAAGLLEIARLEAWCAERSDVGEPVRASDLQLPSSDFAASPEVAACYTREFFERWLANVFAKVDRASAQAESTVERFRNDYESNYAEAWLGFLAGVPRPIAAEPDVLGSPYLALLKTADDNLQVEGLWRGDAPGWVRSLREVRRAEDPDEADADEEADEEAETEDEAADSEEAGEDEKPRGRKAKDLAPWDRYMRALEDVADDVEKAADVSSIALETAKQVGEKGDTPYKKAIDEIKKLVPIEPDDSDANSKEVLRGLLQMPVLNAFSAVLERASKEIDLRWRSRIVSRFPPPLSPEQYARLCDPGGALDIFRQETLGAFWDGTRPRALLEDRVLPVSDGFVAYLEQGCSGGGGGGGGGGLPAGPLHVRLEGKPSSSSAGNVFVLSQTLSLACATREIQTFEYSDGVGQQAFTWTPDCDLVVLAVRVRSSNGVEDEFTREWSGQFAMANFLLEGQGVEGGGTYQWNVKDSAGSGVSVGVRYRRRGGEDIIRFKGVASRSLPATIQ